MKEPTISDLFPNTKCLDCARDIMECHEHLFGSFCLDAVKEEIKKKGGISPKVATKTYYKSYKQMVRQLTNLKRAEPPMCMLVGTYTKAIQLSNKLDKTDDTDEPPMWLTSEGCYWI